MRGIRLLIADRHPIVLQGLTSVFAPQPDFEIVASCSGGTSCVEAIRTLEPDVALLGESLPDLTGSDVLAIVSAENLRTRLVFFAEEIEHGDFVAAITAGAVVRERPAVGVRGTGATSMQNGSWSLDTGS